MILAPLHQRAGTFSPAANTATPRITSRAQFAARLNSLPGRYLVIVRYGPVSTEAGEWIYNGPISTAPKSSGPAIFPAWILAPCCAISAAAAYGLPSLTPLFRVSLPIRWTPNLDAPQSVGHF